ncbi:MAG: Tol-Pal system protein TolB [Alphaproteobacteria bacterium]|nr:Tol-Pal system protein TolB [Alphaproteobacteria bacterium]MBV9150974.1 Tol-Pal system protein TolB [Alphaproteobacteria bacterium]
MTRTRRIFGAVRAALVLLALLMTISPALAQLRLDVTRGKVEPMPIAIPPFAGNGGEEAQTGRDIAQVVSADLESSGLFRPLDPQSFIQNVSATEGPRFADWRQINAQALVGGSVTAQGDGRFRVEFRLWDVGAEQQLAGFAYTTTRQNWRRIAHIIADEIYKRITGEEGYFDTRIVYIAESGPADRREKRLALMDQDGANNQYLTDGRALVLTPRFSPSAQEITYLSYAQGTPRVFLRNIDSGQQEALGDFPGMTFAPRFSPDGNRIVFSRTENGASNIYALDLRTRQASRLTEGNAIDTTPSYSPDASKLVFNSDRGGSQQLYVMSASGGEAHRISFGSGKYGTPVWSPRGDLIAFTKIDGGSFFIGVMRPDGSGERLLTEDFLVEGPTWAPNGRVLMYFRGGRSGGSRAASSRLFTIDLTGGNQREVKTPGDASDPAWSPLLR